MTNSSQEHHVDLTHHPRVRLQWTEHGDYLSVEYHAGQVPPTDDPPITEQQKEHVRQLRQVIRNKLVFFFRREQELNGLLEHLPLGILLNHLEGREMEELIESLMDRCVASLRGNINAWQQTLELVDKYIHRMLAGDHVRLRMDLSTFFDDNSLRVFCHDLRGKCGLRVQYDDLPGETTDAKLVSLIESFERRRQLHDLVAAFVARTGA